jgi:ribokinase
MANILVIGCASNDALHVVGKTYRTIGGAGLYTALAAARVGAATTLLAPYPDPLPEPFSSVLSLIRWIGPCVSPDEMPRLEIEHHGGGRATLLDAAWGAEAQLTPDCLEDDLSHYDVVHIAALSSAQRQLSFLGACRQRDARRISVGTYARIVYGETETVRMLFEQADLSFMNENEARGLLGDSDLWGIAKHSRSEAARGANPKGLVYVTLGDRGALVFANGQQTHVAGIKANELDPTGAGDTFCGAVLAELARGANPVAAAEAGVRLAARVVEGIGPSAVF